MLLEEGVAGAQGVANAALTCDLSQAATIAVARQGNGARIVFRDLRMPHGAMLAGSEVIARLELTDDGAAAAAGAAHLPALAVTLKSVHLGADRWRLVRAVPGTAGRAALLRRAWLLVLPHWEGALVPTARVKLPPLALWEFEDTTRTAGAMNDLAVPTMPWFGATLDRPDHPGLLCIVETAADLQLQPIANYTLQHRYDAQGAVWPLRRIGRTYSPIWLASRGNWGTHALRAITSVPAWTTSPWPSAIAPTPAPLASSSVSRRRWLCTRQSAGLRQGAPYVALYAGYPHYAPSVHPAYANYSYKQVEAAIRDLAHLPLHLPAAFVHLSGRLHQAATAGAAVRYRAGTGRRSVARPSTPPTTPAISSRSTTTSPRSSKDAALGRHADV